MSNHTSLIETLLAVLAAPQDVVVLKPEKEFELLFEARQRRKKTTFLAPRLAYSRPRMTGDPSPEKQAQLDAERLAEAETRRLRKAEQKAENLRRSLKAKGESPT